MKNSLAVSLITLGDPHQITGGYLYQERMAQEAALHAARLSFVSLPDRPFPLPILWSAKALKEAEAVRPGVVLVDSIVASYLALAVPLRRLSVPLCALLHQPPGGVGHGPTRRAVQATMDMLLYRRAALLIVASQLLADEIQMKWRVKPERLCVVPPGRDPLQDRTTRRQTMELRCGCDAAFLCVANWLPHKGIHTLLEAFAVLPRGAAVLHLVGDHRVHPAYTQSIVARAARPDLDGRVHFHGTLPPPAVGAFYRAADVFVLPSHQETYGTVYGEAMSAGLPVVGLRAGNLPNLITSGNEGLLVEPHDVDGLAKAMLTLARDEERRQQMGEASQQRALGYPTWNESARAFFDALRAVAVIKNG